MEQTTSIWKGQGTFIEAPERFIFSFPICFSFALKPESIKGEWVVEKRGQILHSSNFPSVKIRGGWAKCLNEFFQV